MGISVVHHLPHRATALPLHCIYDKWQEDLQISLFDNYTNAKYSPDGDDHQDFWGLQMSNPPDLPALQQDQKPIF